MGDIVACGSFLPTQEFFGQGPPHSAKHSSHCMPTVVVSKRGSNLFGGSHIQSLGDLRERSCAKLQPTRLAGRAAGAKQGDKSTNVP